MLIWYNYFERDLLFCWLNFVWKYKFLSKYYYDSFNSDWGRFKLKHSFINEDWRSLFDCEYWLITLWQINKMYTKCRYTTNHSSTAAGLSTQSEKKLMTIYCRINGKQLKVNTMNYFKILLQDVAHFQSSILLFWMCLFCDIYYCTCAHLSWVLLYSKHWIHRYVYRCACEH